LDKTAVVTKWYQPEVTADGTLVDPLDNPDDWTYEVVAKYAAYAANQSIAKDAEGELETMSGIVTGVTSVEVDDPYGEGVYPAVTRSTFSATADGGVESVTIYNADGAVMATVDGHGETMVSVDASALAPGLYLVSINSHKAHKLLRR
jgi:hypothetical protein